MNELTVIPSYDEGIVKYITDFKIIVNGVQRFGYNGIRFVRHYYSYFNEKEIKNFIRQFIFKTYVIADKTRFIRHDPLKALWVLQEKYNDIDFNKYIVEKEEKRYSRKYHQYNIFNIDKLNISEWKVGVKYKIDDLVVYNKQKYVVLKNHKSESCKNPCSDNYFSCNSLFGGMLQIELIVKYIEVREQIISFLEQKIGSNEYIEELKQLFNTDKNCASFEEYLDLNSKRLFKLFTDNDITFEETEKQKQRRKEFLEKIDHKKASEVVRCKKCRKPLSRDYRDKWICVNINCEDYERRNYKMR
jgi:hypothetical protein